MTLDNRRKKNALTRQMLKDLDQCLDRLSRNSQVSVVILCGAGTDFCAGLDIAELQTTVDADPIEALFSQTEQRLATFPKPVIAAIDGSCIGGGAQLAIACDLRVGTDRAQFAVTPAKLGLLYPTLALSRLVGTIGPAMTKHLMFTAEPIGAATAQQICLITVLTKPEDLDRSALELAETIARRSPFTLTAAKDMINAAINTGISEETERRWTQAHNPDRHIGINAFLENRAAEFDSRPAPGRS
ncbi:enoyl-CoA hydratase/isomerase family protein [Nocardia sp. BSTN01]|uniref:enoyl-CoA hydratase/isomerase family protein n=1 Tax=Nocardia sp. BSTN01 TaxID=2783665 RepID=UPI00188F6B8C|nr:enoyl-CoA hydratase/isomerase family protein [Nocardia sp. BSTN01]MBF5001909.1 enoyl-CoA hydratase/isomerase family protein [Nocardia sp. BSTN01]